MNNDLNDLVKRGAVCDMLHEEMGAWGNCADEIEALLKANDALWKIPAVDAVAVVRCRECLYWQDNNGGYPHEECRWGKGETPDADDFCSYGERKGDD